CGDVDGVAEQGCGAHLFDGDADGLDEVAQRFGGEGTAWGSAGPQPCGGGVGAADERLGSDGVALAQEELSEGFGDSDRVLVEPEGDQAGGRGFDAVGVPCDEAAEGLAEDEDQASGGAGAQIDGLVVEQSADHRPPVVVGGWDDAAASWGYGGGQRSGGQTPLRGPAQEVA